MLLTLPEGIARADGVNGLIIFAVVYAIIAFLGKMKEAGRRAEAGEPPAEPLPRQPVPNRSQRPMAKPVPRRGPRLPPPTRPSSSPGGNTQVEATRLEELLRALGEAAGVPTTQGPMGRRSGTPLPGAEEVEERESLEIEERIQNLESGFERPSRREVDFDDDAEALVQRRIKAAEDRDRPLNRVDHLAFDQRIRQVVADKTMVAKPRKQSMRDAIVWREILGPPLGLRDRDSQEG